ncbi:MAG: OST-HTH/LOTUS domain-containing protein, partial [Acidimicrobiia bacterium]
DSTFAEGDFGFRSFGELVRNLSERGVVRLDASERQGDPVVSFAEESRGESSAFDLLVATVAASDGAGPAALSGLKDEMRKADPSFSEKRLGYGGFLQFVKAANAKGLVGLEYDEESGAYTVTGLSS